MLSTSKHSLRRRQGSSLQDSQGLSANGHSATALSSVRRRQHAKSKHENIGQHVTGILALAVLGLLVWFLFLSSEDAVAASSSSAYRRPSWEFYPRRVLYTREAAVPDYHLRAPNRTTLYSLTYNNNDDGGSTDGKQRRRKIKYPMVDENYFDYLEDARNFRSQPDPMETEDCEPQYDWQSAVYPTCNTLHEMDIAETSNNRVKLIANGYWRDVWIVPDEAGVKRVVKTLRYAHELTTRNYDRNRRDAMSLEHLTSSKYVVEIYGYCSAAGLFEYSDGGDIDAAIWDEEGHSRNLSPLRKLQIAAQGAMGLAAAHNIDQEGRASIAHTDIGPDQFIHVDGRYKLNDFNRARFILRNKENTTQNCPYYVGKNPGKKRSPEEYRYDAQSEKVDIFSYGHVIYILLQEEYPFSDVKAEEAKKLIMRGVRPSVYVDIWNSTDPIVQALKQAMILCHEHDPEKRVSARDLETFLKDKLREFDPGRLEEWGDA